jgi:hypothetical protein
MSPHKAKKNGSCECTFTQAASQPASVAAKAPGNSDARPEILVPAAFARVADKPRQAIRLSGLLQKAKEKERLNRAAIEN